METNSLVKSTRQTVVKILGILALFVAMGLEIYNVVHVSGYDIIMNVMYIVALLSAMFYALYGYKKESAVFFKIFVAFFAIGELMLIPTLVEVNAGIDNLITTTIVFGLLCVLALAMDLGKLKSVVLGVIIVLLSVRDLVEAIMASNINESILGGVANMVLCTVLLLMILAKYYNKAERGAN